VLLVAGVQSEGSSRKVWKRDTASESSTTRRPLLDILKVGLGVNFWDCGME
jgi:hypothetical protein